MSASQDLPILLTTMQSHFKLHTFLIFLGSQSYEPSHQEVTIGLLAQVQDVWQELLKKLAPLLCCAVLDACLEYSRPCWRSGSLQNPTLNLW